jgi:hypothetical protein
MVCLWKGQRSGEGGWGMRSTEWRGYNCHSLYQFILLSENIVIQNPVVQRF